MNNSKAGVIYMSLGSDRVDMENQIALFATAFAELRQKILLKYEGKITWRPPPNIKIDNWFPQQDVLGKSI